MVEIKMENSDRKVGTRQSSRATDTESSYCIDELNKSGQVNETRRTSWSHNDVNERNRTHFSRTVIK